MARQVAGVPEDHTPGHSGDASPELAVDEVTHAPSSEAERRERRDEVHDAEVRSVMAPCRETHGEHHAEKAAVEGHAALPDGEDFERMAYVVARLVEKHIAQASAEDHAQHGEKYEIVELLAIDRG